MTEYECYQDLKARMNHVTITARLLSDFIAQHISNEDIQHNLTNLIMAFTEASVDAVISKLSETGPKASK